MPERSESDQLRLGKRYVGEPAGLVDQTMSAPDRARAVWMSGRNMV
jgi:hypothetical protein